jgi:hypothetical protein
LGSGVRENLDRRLSMVMNFPLLLIIRPPSCGKVRGTSFIRHCLPFNCTDRT